MRSTPTGAFGKLLLFLAAASLLVAVGAAWRNRIAPPASAAGPIAISENEAPAPSPTDPVEALEPAPDESAEMSGVQQQVAAGLTLEASNLRFEEEETDGVTLKLDLCFPIPTNADWEIHSASLNFSGFVVGDYGTIPIEIRLVNDDGTVAELLAKAQLAIDALAEGIVLACTADEANGYAGLGIERIPEGMSQEAAEGIFYSDDFYLAMFGVAGPWVFVYPEAPDDDLLLSLEQGFANLERSEGLPPDQPDGFVVSQAQALLNLITRKVTDSDTSWIHLISKDQEMEQ